MGSKSLLAGTVPANKKLLAETVLANQSLFAGTVFRSITSFNFKKPEKKNNIFVSFNNGHGVEL